MHKKTSKPLIIGLTGGYGTGKSTVAAMLRRSGAIVLDADKMAHLTLKKGSHCYKGIIASFGRDILKASGGIDRGILAGKAFKSRGSVKKLTGIIHPIVIRDIKKSIKKISASKRAPIIVIDAPLLIEAGLQKEVDYIIVVKASRAKQMRRIAKKTGLSKNEIMRRIKMQIPLAKKIRLADIVIDNNGKMDKTKKTFKAILSGIKKKRR